MPAPEWYVTRGATWGKDPGELNYLWDQCIAAGLGKAGAQLMLAILPQEGTGSFNTSAENRAGDGGNGPESDWQRDVRRAVTLVQGKLRTYAQGLDQGFRSLAQQVVSQGDGGAVRASGGPIEWVNWHTAIVDPDGSVRLGAYAQHGSWWVGVSHFFAQVGGQAEELEAVARSLDPTAPRLQMQMEVVRDQVDLASNWNATAPEPAVVVTACDVLAPAEAGAGAGQTGVPLLYGEAVVGYGHIKADRYILETPLLVPLLEMGGRYDGELVSFRDVAVRIRRPSYRFDKPLAVLLDAMGLQRGKDYDWRTDPQALIIYKGA